MDKKHLKRIIAVEIKKARIRAGLTQKAVLLETGVHVGRIEMGRNSIDICTFFKLCLFLEVDIQKIISELKANSKNLQFLIGGTNFLLS